MGAICCAPLSSVARGMLHDVAISGRIRGGLPRYQKHGRRLADLGLLRKYGGDWLPGPLFGWWYESQPDDYRARVERLRARYG